MMHAHDLHEQAAYACIIECMYVGCGLYVAYSHTHIHIRVVWHMIVSVCMRIGRYSNHEDS